MRKLLDDIRPTRHLVTRDGEAISHSQWKTRTDGYPLPLVIWVRNDGWTLAAEAGLEIPARNLWYKEWVGVWNLVYDAPQQDTYEYHDLTGENRLADLEAAIPADNSDEAWEAYAREMTTP